LVLGFTLCTVVSLLALVALWWFYGATPATRTDDRLAVDPTQIQPALALMHLAGDPVEALATQALQAGEYATSQALITFGVDATAKPHLSLMLQLAKRLQQQGDQRQALLLLRKARAGAILDTTLTPLERADALLLCTAMLLTAEAPAEALDSAQQVKQIAEQTPDLLPAERSRLLQELLPLANQLTDEPLRQQIRELARSPYLSPEGILIQEPLPFADGSFELDQQLTDIIRNRQGLARQLAEQIIQSPLADKASLIDTLGQALRTEDQQRSLYFKQILSTPDLTFSLQFWSASEQRQWLILKLAVAYGTFGISIVPEWETTIPAIQEELTSTTDILRDILLEGAQTQTEPLAQLRQRIAILRWLALQAEVGLYLDRVTDIDERLRIAQEELTQMGTSAALPVRYRSDATPPGYRITSNR
jgi:hypothetical protein